MVSQMGHSVLQRSATRPKMNWLRSSMQPEAPTANATCSAARRKNDLESAAKQRGEPSMRTAAGSVLAFIGALGCGPRAPPEAPVILAGVAPLGFDAQFGRGTLSGQAPVNRLTVRNEGQAD